MKIGFLTAEYAFGNRRRGGLGNYLRRLTLALAERGHQPHVFYYIDEPTGIHVDQGIHIHFVNNRRSKLISQLRRATRQKLRQTLDGLERCYRLRRYLHEAIHKCSLDIIQAPSSNWPGLLVSSEVPMVIRGSSYRPIVDKYAGITRKIDRRLYTRLEALQYRRAAGIFTPTRFLARILEKNLGLSDIAVIRTPFYNEVTELDDSLYEQELQGKDYLLFFGKLSPLKGARALANALPDVWEEHPNLMAVFVGEDRRLEGRMMMTEFIRRTCAKYEQNLRFYPLTPHEELYPIIRNARLVVLPSLFDNSPNAMLEAMGFGKPVVGTYGSSMDEFIEDGISGFLVDPGDSDELAEKICEAWGHQDLVGIGEAARNAISRLSPEDVLPQLLGFYQKHLN